MKIYGYIRVSTDKQTTENQKFEICRFLSEKSLSVDVWVNETVSGTVSFRKRRLGKTLRALKSGDVLICSELSRLGRTILDVLTILNRCIEKGVSVWMVKENYRLDKIPNDGVCFFHGGTVGTIAHQPADTRSFGAFESGGQTAGTQKRQPQQHARFGRERGADFAIKPTRRNKNQHRPKSQSQLWNNPQFF